ncbi:alpha-amylase family protein [Micrococcales bacterium 31B]|nr:alpha-amylase family protein [Micrococcales bacterium 31B]
MPDVAKGLADLYPGAVEETLFRLTDLARAGYAARPAALKLRDLDALVNPDWHQQPNQLGYAAYADRFAGTLQGVRERVPYLANLGVTYLHLMPLLRPRPGESDGGYAVMDYRSVREDLGTMDDLAQLADTVHGAGMALTLDLVLNHVAREHEWAVKARSGDPKYREYFHLFADRGLPDEYERSLPEVFPDFAPGNFTWDDEAKAHVWTTFNAWQWDVNWHNPDVFVEYADIVLNLANHGVDCLRLDALAFMWKRLGTACQNQPEVHAITQALRSIAKIVAPALIFKAEAIVGPDDLLPYLGLGKHTSKVSELAYHNSLMVQIWSALASGDGTLMERALGRFGAKSPTAAWGTYVRCHDDIGWAIDDGDAAAIGSNGYLHRAFLSEYYSGDAPGSPAQGLVFQENPATGDRRISGAGASLCGVEAALAAGDADALNLAMRRFILAYAMAFGFGGIPLVYMGDELALTNDYSFAGVPEHAADNRWVHRPRMPWDLADAAVAWFGDSHDLRVASASWMHRSIAHFGRVRASLPGMHAQFETRVETTSNPALVLFIRDTHEQRIVQVYNVSARRQSVSPAEVPVPDSARDALSDSHKWNFVGFGEFTLEPYAHAWFVV